MARSIAILATAFAATMAAVDVGLSDRTWWSEALAVWPPLLWALPALLGALAARMLGARRASTVAALVTFVSVALAVEWTTLLRRGRAEASSRWESARSPTGNGPLALRVVTWNVSRERVLPRLESMRPDLCLFQESAPPSAGDKASAAWQGYAWQGGEDPGTFSRWPTTTLPTAPIGPWTPPLLTRVDAPGGRRLIVVNVRLVLPGIVLAAVDPSSPYDLAGRHARRVAQFENLAALIARTQAAEGVKTVILCGDFNTPANMASLAPLSRVYRDVWPVGGIGWGGTMGEDIPLSRIDQCWVSPDVEVVQARVQRGQPSDHRMLMVDLLVP